MKKLLLKLNIIIYNIINSNWILSDPLAPENINIGQKLIHNDKGEITVLGIVPHCGDYAIYIKDSWVYLKNCNITKTKLL
jgi:hypothetical protein